MPINLIQYTDSRHNNAVHCLVGDPTCDYRLSTVTSLLAMAMSLTCLVNNDYYIDTYLVCLVNDVVLFYTDAATHSHRTATSVLQKDIQKSSLNNSDTLFDAYVCV